MNDPRRRLDDVLTRCDNAFSVTIACEERRTDLVGLRD